MNVTGHEDEFRRLFEQEAGTRLTALAEHAMELESDADHTELVTEMFRDAHTLKGGAAVVGFDQLAAVVHELEQLLEELRAGARRPGPTLVDGVLATIDALREMIDRAMAGADGGEAAAAARAALATARSGEPAADAHIPPSQPAAPATEPAAPTVTTAPWPSGGPAPPAPRKDAVGGATRAPADAIPVPVVRLDQLTRLVGESAGALLRIGRLLSERFGDEPTVLDEYCELTSVLSELQERMMRARMVSVGTIAAPLRRAVRDLARQTGKSARWELIGADTELDRHVLEQLREPLVALVRNAVDHGLETSDERAARDKPREGVVRVHAQQIGAEVVISVADDGRGIDVEQIRRRTRRRLSDEDALKAIFDPGLSTARAVTGVSGRGVGLDAVRSAVDLLGGRIEVRSSLGLGSELRISVPMTLATLRCLLVRAGAQRYALPMHSTATALRAGADTIVPVEGRPALLLSGTTVGVTDLTAVLGLPGAEGPASGPALVLRTAAGSHAFTVDELLGQRDVVVKDLGRALPRLELVAGASVEPDGAIMLVLDPDGLIGRARAAARAPAARAGPVPRPASSRARVLVVDDALTIRELQRSILERAGYEVMTAADGQAALRVLDERPVDLVLTDIEMPMLDGFALTAAIRAAPELSATPVLILTSRADATDRQRGLEAGADAYLVKSAFDEHALLTAVQRLLGEPA